MTLSALRLPHSLLCVTIASVLLTACQNMSALNVQPNNIHPKTTSSTLNLNMQNLHKYQLDNGLTLLVKTDNRAPVVMTQIWYKVGASDEPDDKGGISHLLEHMMFKGTKNISSDDFEAVIARYGGENNAFTSYDYTGYYELLPTPFYTLALELEADRMHGLNFADSAFAAAFAKERQVVMEERRQRTDDNPTAKAYEKFRKLALPNSPKGESVIGPMDEIESIGINDLKKWYETWYTPDNATLVVVGDVQPEEVYQQAMTYFAHLGSDKQQTKTQRPSVTQTGFRGYQKVIEQTAVQSPILMMAYNVPSLTTAKPDTDAYALSLLHQVLDGGLSARLESKLVREQGLLASIGSSYDLFDRGDGLFMIQATPRENVSLDDAQEAIIAELDKLKTQPISADEIDLAKTNLSTGLIYSQDSIAGQAQLIGSLHSIGLDSKILNNVIDEYSKLSVDDLHHTANRYFVKDNLTVMHLIPNEN